MRNSIKTNRRNKFVNLFGAFGYIFTAILWLSSLIIYSEFIKSLLKVEQPVQKPITQPTVVIDIASNQPLMIAGVIFTIAVVVLSIYVFIKIPSTTVKTTKQAVHKTAEAITPVVLQVQHIKSTPAKRKKVMFNTTIALKVLIIIIPLILAVCSSYIPDRLFDVSTALTISLWPASFALLFFLLQYITGRLLSVKSQDIW